MHQMRSYAVIIWLVKKKDDASHFLAFKAISINEILLKVDFKKQERVFNMSEAKLK